MKKLTLISLTLLVIFSCSKPQEVDPFANASKPANVSTITENILIKTNEYIEKSKNETLFLFKAPKGAEIKFYIKEKGKWFNKKTSIESYDGNGLVINGLEPGKIYEYQIVSTYNGKKIKSNTETYTKEALNITKDRPKWAKEAVFYEVFVRSFYDSDKNEIGDVKGLKEKIPYFKELGVDALWLMPINPSPSYHGYDVKDYKGINEEYGSLEDFKEFLKEAKKNNIKVIIDFVLNHSSSEHPWFVEAKTDKNSPYRDYYVWADAFDNTNLSGDTGQNVWHNAGNDKYFGIFWNGMPDLNYRNPKLRQEIKNASKFWLDLGVDGFRLDASKYIDPNNDVTQLWWHDFNSYVKSINKDAFIVGENWDKSVNYVSKFMESMDSSFNFNISDQIVEMARGGNVDIIKEIEKRDAIYSQVNPNFIDTIFLRNHDMTRLSNELLNDIQKQKFAMSILLTLPGTPFIYYGEELGMQGRKPDENLREPMDWYKNTNGLGMTSRPSRNVDLVYTNPNDGISVEEETGDKNSILEFTKKLIKIRKENPIIVSGKYKKLDLGYKINAYEIGTGNQKLTVVHNSNNKNITINLENKTYEISNSSTGIIKNGVNLLF